MKREVRETSISFLARAAATFVLMLLTTATAWAALYVDENGETHDVNATYLSNGGHIGEEGVESWYVVRNDIGEPIDIHGDVYLIIEEPYTDTTVTIAGITIESNSSLTIYKYSAKHGLLIVEPGNGNGIYVDGRLTINSGVVTFNASGSGKGISVNSGGSVTVNGGTVTANGISVEYDASFTVKSGTVNATGSNAISVGGDFTVNGGTVTANPSGGHGINVGTSEASFTVNGGNVRATGNYGINVYLDYDEYGDFTVNGGSVAASSCQGILTLSGGSFMASSYSDAIPSLVISGNLTYTDGTTASYTGIISNPVAGTAYQQEWEGSGETGTPYQIKNSNDLDLLARRVNAGTTFSGTYFELTNDIKYIIYLLSAVNTTTYVENYTAIGSPGTPFCGTFDGANHAIIGVRIKKTGQTDADSYQGLFGYVGTAGSVKNIILDDAWIAGYQNVGGIVGENAGTVENCHVLNKSQINVITAGADCHGDIAGSNSGTVTRCSSEAGHQPSDNNHKNYGGIVGSNSGTVSDCITLGGGITGSSYIGAIIGYNTGSVTGSYFTSTSAVGQDNLGGSLTGDDRAVGYNDGGTVTNCRIAPQDTQDNSHFLTLMALRTEALTAVMRPNPLDTDLQFALNDRTFYKDGKWNTLCLPFNYSAWQISKQPDFAGATLMEMDTEGKNGFDPTDGTLYLTFKEATEIRAGVPYLVKWDDEGTEFASPQFAGMTIAADFNATATPSVTCSSDGLEPVQMVGCYSPAPVEADNKSILYLGEGNTLYYSTVSRDIRSFRAYFSVPYIKGNAGASEARAFRLDFGEGEASSINEELRMKNEEFAAATEWHTLDGRRLAGKPTKSGVYISNGRKIVIK